jgi:hypothetical protein
VVLARPPIRLAGLSRLVLSPGRRLVQCNDGVTSRNHDRPARRARGQHTVVQNQIDSRPRRESGETFEELDRLEQEMGRPIGPPSPQRQFTFAPTRTTLVRITQTDTGATRVVGPQSDRL